MGKMGAGKTLTMSVLMEYFHHVTGAPLSANYTLKDAKMIESLDAVVKENAGILGFDEIWLSADSREWGNNVRLTQWVNQTRKKKMIVFYTTQHIRQVEMRIRNGTDVLIVCEKKGDGHWLTFIDYQYRTIGRRYLIPFESAKKFYSLYDTYEVLKPLRWEVKKSTSAWDNVRTVKGRRNY